MIDPEFQPFLNTLGQLISWPARSKKQLLALHYLASKVVPGQRYTERELNALLNQHHTFKDPALLRRELYMKRLLDREPDGSAYWSTAGASPT